MERFLWGLTVFCSTLGMFVLLGIAGAESAPQEAAVAAIAAALAVVPYCLARALSEIRRGTENKAD
jgi:hypothetical protein